MRGTPRRGKGCTRQSADLTPHRYPDRQSAACVIFVSYLWTHLRYEGSEGSEGGGGGWHRRLCRRVVSPQGKRLTMICASLALLHPLLSLTHWIFRSLMLPYKSSSHSANHVCCASLRSGSKETRKSAAFPMDMQGFETSTHQKLSL